MKFVLRFVFILPVCLRFCLFTSAGFSTFWHVTKAHAIFAEDPQNNITYWEHPYLP